VVGPNGHGSLPSVHGVRASHIHKKQAPEPGKPEATTEAGRDALGYYHERRDKNGNVGLGPEHDWSSHAGDSFGYMVLSYEEPPVKNLSTLNQRSAELPRGSIALESVILARAACLYSSQYALDLARLARD
jgi:hypothetical protein